MISYGCNQIASTNENEAVVSDVMQVAKADIEERRKIILYTFAGTTFLLMIPELLLSIEWNAQTQSLFARMPYLAIIPGVIMILYSIICKLRGKKTQGMWAFGIILLLLPIIVICSAFLIFGLIYG